MLKQKSQYPELSDLINKIESNPDVFDFVESELEKESAKLSADKNISQERLSKLLKVITKISSIAKIPHDLYLTYKNVKKKLKVVSDALETVERKIGQLKFYQDNVYKYLLPLLGNIQNDVNFFVNNMDSKSRVGLMELHWQIRDYLKNIQHQVQKICQSFEMEQNIVQYIEELNDLMTRIINLYDYQQVYQDHKVFVDYIANINSENFNMLQDGKYRESLNNLEYIIKANVVMSQYFSAVKAFTHSVFPFADLYFTNFNLPKIFQSDKDINSLVPSVIKQIENMHVKFKESQITTTKYDPFIHYGWFNSENKNTGSFFTWKNSDYQDLISKLLSGSEILIKADITKSSHLYNAVKFNQIGIDFKVSDKTVQYELNKLLENFSVILTHSGDSYYRCDDNYYVIMSDKQVIRYDFAQNSNGEPKNRNSIYEKLKASHYVLSPYSMWSIKLVKITDRSFDILNKYRKFVDLELVGSGQYISNGIDICSTELDVYYKRFTNEIKFDDVNLHRQIYITINRYLSDLTSDRSSASDIEVTVDQQQSKVHDKSNQACKYRKNFCNICSETNYKNCDEFSALSNDEEFYNQEGCEMDNKDNFNQKCDYEESIENYLFAVNSASSHKPMGSNVFTWVNFVISKVKNLFINEQTENKLEFDNFKLIKPVIDNQHSGLYTKFNNTMDLSSNSQAFKWHERLTEQRDDENQSLTINQINFNSTLLLTNFFVHKLTGVKNNNTSSFTILNENQKINSLRLAYNAYAPYFVENEKYQNL